MVLRKSASRGVSTGAGHTLLIRTCADFGIPTQVRHLYRGDEVPTDLDELRMLVILGGPMDVKDLDKTVEV